jgi:Fur family transcriptional regulator, ferric uptake regulator
MKSAKGKKGTVPICAQHPEGGHRPKAGLGKWGLSPFSEQLRSVPVKLPPEGRFAEFLEGRSKRFTSQRRLIVEQVFSHHDHFDAEELIEHLQPLMAKRRLSRPTIYRTLGELVEAGMLRVMELGGRNVYEHQYGYPSHDHLYCQMCNKLIEFQSDDLERLRDVVARRYNFQVLSHRMFVVGICADCRRQE